jgi:predicted CopG family antitoxin
LIAKPSGNQSFSEIVKNGKNGKREGNFEIALFL